MRYGDDCQIYAGSRKAAERIFRKMTRFLEKTMRLKVNQTKSAVDRPWKRKLEIPHDSMERMENTKNQEEEMAGLGYLPLKPMNGKTPGKDTGG